MEADLGCIREMVGSGGRATGDGERITFVGGDSFERHPHSEVSVVSDAHGRTGGDGGAAGDVDAHAETDFVAVEELPPRWLRVRAHELEIFVQNFPRTVLLFTVIYSTLSLASSGLFIWLVVGFFMDLNRDCDVPLRLWAITDFVSTAYNWIHAAMINCLYGPDWHTNDNLPRCERVHVVLVSILDYVWLAIGVYWVQIAHSCGTTSPHFFIAAKVYVLSSVVVGMIICINAIGLYAIMSRMLRNGFLRTKNGAPPGTLAKLSVMRFDPELDVFRENPDCCICLATFDSSAEIRVTTCKHAFHGRCLGNWLTVSRTCPLCRKDLTCVESADAAHGQTIWGRASE